MVIPIDQDGRVQTAPEEMFWKNIDTRLAGGQRHLKEPMQVSVKICNLL